MDKRSSILQALKNTSGVRRKEPPETYRHTVDGMDLVAAFSEVLRSIGGAAVEIDSKAGAEEYIRQHFESSENILSAVSYVASSYTGGGDSRSFDAVEVFITSSTLGVAENGAVWITDTSMQHRVLPFITQHLVVLINSESLVATMHDAYEKIGNEDYSFGTFIAGPSKTADIEQSLVLGAHGPKTMTVILIKKPD